MEVKEYNNIEEIEKLNSSNYIIEAFSPFHFQLSGYPSRIDNIKELEKFHDVMHENRFLQNLQHLKYISEEDFNLLKSVSIKIEEFSKSFNFSSSGKNSLSRAMIIRRAINSFFKKKINILEVGPGNGFLAPLLYNDGHNYFGQEITQAFYLYQSNFWKFYFDKDYSNHAKSVKQEKINRINHIPWWTWTSDKNIDYNLDIVVANHVLCEMNTNALIFTFKKIINLFNNNGYKIILCEGVGSRRYNSFENVVSILSKIGWELVSTEENIYVFLHNTSNSKYKNLFRFKNRVNYRLLFKSLKNDKKLFMNYLINIINFYIRKKYRFKIINRILVNKLFKNIPSNDKNYTKEVITHFQKNSKNSKDEIFLKYINI